MFLLLSMFCGLTSPRVGVPVGVKSATQPERWCSCLCQICDTSGVLVFLPLSVLRYSPSVRIRASFSVLRHSPNIAIHAGVIVM